MTVSRASWSWRLPTATGRDASLFVDVFVEKNQSKTFSRYVKIAGQSSVVTCRLLTPAGRLVSRGMADLTNPNQNYQALNATESLVLSIGSPAGLYELSKEPSPDQADAAEIPQVVNCSMLVSEMPAQWFAYEAASAVVMATSSEAFFDNIDPLRISALRSWVRQGGHLVVSVANNWQVVSKSFLGPMLPAELTGLGSTRSPEVLETYINAKIRFDLGRGGLPIATLANLRGRVELEQGDRPLAVSGSYGLGRVTLLTFDTDAAPFQNWVGRTAFWAKLLGFQRESEGRDDPGPSRWPTASQCGERVGHRSAQLPGTFP